MWSGIFNFLRLMEGDIIYDEKALLALVFTVATCIADKREQLFSMRVVGF